MILNRLISCICIIFIGFFVNTASGFEVYYGGKYQQAPDFRDFGLQYAEILYPNEIWRGKSEIDTPPSVLQAKKAIAIAKKVKYPGAIYVLDIEHWGLKGDQASIHFGKFRQTAENYKFALKGEGIPFGFYANFPQRDVYAAIRNDQHWISRNRQFQEISDYVDMINPSLYTLIPSQKKWKQFAENSLIEAKKYGKPVYPLIWPQYHQSVRFKGGQFIEDSFWRLQLETIFKHADGVIIWGGWDIVNKGKRDRRMLWDDHASWWLVTQQFLEDYNLVDESNKDIHSSDPNQGATVE